jgi:hypothetical protein
MIYEKLMEIVFLFPKLSELKPVCPITGELLATEFDFLCRYSI